jgi:hypothetical protein
MNKENEKFIGSGSENVRDKNQSVNEKWLKECDEYINKKLKNELKRINNIFLPGENFYVGGEPRDVLLHMATQILDWLKIELKEGELVIDFYDKIDYPGLYTEIEGQKYILVNSTYKNDIFAIGAVLSHEIMHFYLLGRKNLRMEDTLENELLTDLCTIKFGLGLPIVNGMSYSNSWFSSILLLFVGVLRWSSQKLSFGYFNPHQYGNLVSEDLEERKLAIKNVGGYIQPNSRTFLSRGIGMLWRVKKGSKLVKTLVKKQRTGFVAKIAVVIIGCSFFIWSNAEHEATQSALKQQKTHIEYLGEYLENNETEIEKLIEEFEVLDSNLSEYERLGNTEAYNSLVPEYNKKLEDLAHYNEKYEEYEKQIDDYNSKL